VGGHSEPSVVERKYAFHVISELDGSGTHVSTRDEENFRAFTNFSYQIPVEICESKSARRRLVRYLRKKYGTYSVFHPIGFLARIKRRMLH
jgi:hypothetical protein